MRDLSAVGSDEKSIPTGIFEIISNGNTAIRRTFQLEKFFEFIDCICGDNSGGKLRELLPDLQRGKSGGWDVVKISLLFKQLRKAFSSTSLRETIGGITARVKGQKLSGDTRATLNGLKLDYALLIVLEPTDRKGRFVSEY